MTKSYVNNVATFRIPGHMSLLPQAIVRVYALERCLYKRDLKELEAF